MGHLAPCEIFENMLQLKSFGLYFEGILNRKCLLSYSSDISYRDARGFGACENLTGMYLGSYHGRLLVTMV